MSRLITQLGYVGIEASDLAAWDLFANEVLGLGVREGPVPGVRFYRMDQRDRRFILQQGPSDDVSFVGWEAASEAALNAFARHLEGLKIGYEWGLASEASLRGVKQFLHFKDPLGVRNEVYHCPMMARERYTSPKVAGSYVTDEGGLGHIVFGAGDLYEKSIQFSKDVLGAVMTDICHQPTSDPVGIEATFLHVNERHHSLAIADRAGPRKLHHIMIEVDRMDEVGRARDRALALGCAFPMDIGQHTNDKMFSFYVVTPSGFQIEFGWGGVKVDDADWRVVKYPSFSEWGHRPSGM